MWKLNCEFSYIVTSVGFNKIKKKKNWCIVSGITPENEIQLNPLSFNITCANPTQCHFNINFLFCFLVPFFKVTVKPKNAILPIWYWFVFFFFFYSLHFDIFLVLFSDLHTQYSPFVLIRIFNLFYFYTYYVVLFLLFFLFLDLDDVFILYQRNGVCFVIVGVVASSIWIATLTISLNNKHLENWLKIKFQTNRSRSRIESDKCHKKFFFFSSFRRCWTVMHFGCFSYGPMETIPIDARCNFIKKNKNKMKKLFHHKHFAVYWHFNANIANLLDIFYLKMPDWTSHTNTLQTAHNIKVQNT